MENSLDLRNISPARLAEIKRYTERQLARVRRSGNKRVEKVYEHAAQLLIENNDPSFYNACANMQHVPVTIDEFIESEDFLGHDPDFKIWPTLRQDLRDMNPDIWTGEEHIFQTFDGGATGTGKTVKATTTQAYQLYVLNCFKKPVKLWPRLSSNTPLLFVFQSVQERVTKRVIYEPFRSMFTALPFVKRFLTWDKDKENVLQFDTGIQVVPALAALNNIVGQAIVSAILDEVNFMAVVEESKQIVGARGQGGKFDQAQIIYNNITRRRKSRFITKGPSPGIISVLSSVRYIGDFMDRRMQEIRDHEEKNIKVITRAQYEAQPAEDYSGKKFRLLVGRTEYATRVLKDSEVEGVDFPAGARVLEIPIEYIDDFRRDPEGSLRDVCGIATDVIAPFITQRHKIIAAVMRGTERNLKPWVVNADIELGNEDLGGRSMPQIIPENLPKDKDKPRFVHVDLAITGSGGANRCGIAIVKVDGHMAVTNEDGVTDFVPHFTLEQGITIKPSQAHELDIEEVRKWIVSLKKYYGINIHTVSYDGFESAQSIQMLRKAGIASWAVSMDKTMEPYEHLKSALYSDRLDMQDQEILKVELAGLEVNHKKKKVDHPPKGSKDLADAVAGALYTASQNRNTRANTGTAKAGVSTTKNGRPVTHERPSSQARRVRR